MSILYWRLFLARFFRSPLQIGSVIPSSQKLVQAMLSPVPWNQIDTVVELGAGTGVITQALKKYHKPGTETFIFENDPVLQSLLRRRYPEFHFASDAAMMDTVLSQQNMNGSDVILSSLPFSNFSIDSRVRILDQICDTLKTDGIFIAYQYSQHIKPLLQERFQEVEIRWVPWNIPPAFVYICRKPIPEGT